MDQKPRFSTTLLKMTWPVLLLGQRKNRHMSSTWRTTGIPYLISRGKSSFDLKEKDENRDYFGLSSDCDCYPEPTIYSVFQTERAYHLWG